MFELYERSIAKLELNQVLSQLSECAGSALGKSACLELCPTSDVEDVRTLLLQTTAALDLVALKGNLNFSGVCDVTASLERAERGGSLQPKELLEIAGVLRCTRNVKAYTEDDEQKTVLDNYFQVLVPNKFLEEKIYNSCPREIWT